MAAFAQTRDLCRWRLGCALCDSPRLSPLLELAPTPLATAFGMGEAAASDEIRYPLELVLCDACGHVQLGHIVDRFKVLGGPVVPVSSSSTWQAHLQASARDLMARFSGEAGALIVDVGSNDGSFLKVFEKEGWRLQGVEPSVNVAGTAIAQGIPTFPGFFMPSTAARIEDERGRATLITTQQLFAETDDPIGFIEAVKALLAPGGLFVFEVSYLGDLVAQTGFDAVTHARLDYHSVAPLVDFFARHQLELIEIKRTPLHHGSIRGVVQRRGGPHRGDGSVPAHVADERRIALTDPATFERMARRIEAIGREVQQRLRDLQAAGQRLAGFGAGPRATTLLYRFGLDADLIPFIVDDHAITRGRRMPGSGIPILGGDALDRERPDVVVILAWGHAEAIIARYGHFREAGGRFLIPLPEPRLV